MKYFNRGTTIRIEIKTKRRSAQVNILADITGSALLTIYDPDRGSVASDVIMSNEGTGLYYYNYQSSSSAKRGIYKVRYTISDSGYTTIYEDNGFKLI